jgi:hypothetical protein
MYDLFNIVNFNDGRYSTDGAVCTLYYFNKDRPFIIIQGYAYGLLLYYYDINSMNLILLNEQENGAEDYYIYNSFYNTFFFDAINNRDSIITDKKFKKKYLLCNFIIHCSHSDIELYGLSYLLDNINNLEEYIDTIVVGNSDIYQIVSYLKYEYPKLNIITYEEFMKIEDGIPFYITSYPPCNKTRNILAKINSLQYENNNVIKYIDNYKNMELFKNNIIEITFDIKTNRRILYNIIDFYVYIINNLINDFPNYIIKIFFTGFVHNTNEIFLNEQHNIANNIINSFNNNNLIFINLIGQSFHNILNNIINNDLFIGCGGTAAIHIIRWIFKKKTFSYSVIDFGVYYEFDRTHDSTSCSNYIPKEFIQFDGSDPNNSNFTIIDIPSTYLLIKNILLNE